MLPQKTIINPSVKDFKAPEILGKIAVLTLTIYWTYRIFFPPTFQPLPWIFLDNVNLVFHEAGHIIFIIFGSFMNILGGSLMQVFIPAIIGINFLRTRQYFSLGFATFWLGESLINLSYYIGDAQAQRLPLLGGDNGNHDWKLILTTLNILQFNWLVSGITYFFGSIILIIGIGIMASNILYILKRKSI